MKKLTTILLVSVGLLTITSTVCKASDFYDPVSIPKIEKASTELISTDVLVINQVALPTTAVIFLCNDYPFTMASGPGEDHPITVYENKTTEHMAAELTPSHLVERLYYRSIQRPDIAEERWRTVAINPAENYLVSLSKKPPKILRS